MIPQIIKEQYLLSVKNLNIKMIANHALWYKHIKNLPQPQQAVYTILVFDNYIKTEGFLAYFTSSFGMFAQETLDNFQKIGSSKHSNILQRVLESCKNEPIEDLSHYDEEYKAIQSESIGDLLLMFAQNS